MIGKSLDAHGFDGEFFHLDAPALRVAGKRAHVVDQMPRVGAVGPIAHWHRTSRNARDDMTVKGDRIRATFKNARGKITRSGREPFVIFLLLGSIASSGVAVARGAGILV